MLFVPMIQYHITEMRVLREAFAPIHQIEDLFNEFGGPEEVKRIVNRTSDQRGPLRIQDLEPGLRLLTLLADRLLLSARSVADPDWVAQTKRQRAEGKLPLILDPEAAVKVINETRRHQYGRATDGLQILKQAVAYLKQVTEQTPEAPGDNYDESGDRPGPEDDEEPSPRIDFAGSGVVDGVDTKGRRVFHLDGSVADVAAFKEAFGHEPPTPAFRDTAWDSFYDVVVEALGKGLDRSALVKLWWTLPDDIRQTARMHGMSDTVFKDKAYSFLKKK